MSQMPRCIRCDDNRSVYHEGDRNYYCRTCKVCFDDEPDESGGDYCTDPTRRIQREETRAQNQRERMLGRRRG